MPTSPAKGHTQCLRLVFTFATASEQAALAPETCDGDDDRKVVKGNAASPGRHRQRPACCANKAQILMLK